MSDLKEVKNGYRPIIADQEIAALFNPAGLPMSVHAAAERLNQFVAKVAELEAEKADLMEICKDAIDEVVDWSSYASEYFQEKYDLRGSLRDLRKRLGKYHRDLETAMSKEAIRQAIKEGGE